MRISDDGTLHRLSHHMHVAVYTYVHTYVCAAPDDLMYVQYSTYVVDSDNVLESVYAFSVV